MGKEIIDLYGLQSMLKEGIGQMFPSMLWVKAEISSIKARNAGHCYIELSQSGDNGLEAKAQAVIWSSKYRFIAPFFESVTGTALQEGMLVLVQVQVNYSHLYGLSLVINDIDPDFSLGEKERKRRETMARLEAEGLVGMQKELALPLLPYRIAVVSAPDAAGYRDFMKHLHENTYGFVFQTELFPALMQGEESPVSIVSAMSESIASGCRYDLVAIIRGGGAKLDLSCYDDYGLAAYIARFPIPVFTAVGHDQDTHACDAVSYMSLKTPTAMADELINMYIDEDSRLSSFAGRLKMAFSSAVYRAESDLRAVAVRIPRAFLMKISVMENRIDFIEKRLHSSDPRVILRKGYSLSVNSSGQVLHTVTGLSSGDRLDVLLHDGKIVCEVKNVEQVNMDDNIVE